MSMKTALPGSCLLAAAFCYVTIGQTGWVKRDEIEPVGTAGEEAKKIWDWVLKHGGVKSVFEVERSFGDMPKYLIVLETPLRTDRLQSMFGEPDETAQGTLISSVGRMPPTWCRLWHYGPVRIAVHSDVIHEIHGDFQPPQQP